MTATPDLFEYAQTRYPHVPGSKATETSAAAAESAKDGAETLRARCLEALAISDRTADEAAEYLGESILSIRPRFSELRKMGKILPTDKRRLSQNGHSSIVWKVA